MPPEEHCVGTWTVLAKYLEIFSNLWTDRGRDRYPEITFHRAPHKPFLLLSVMDLIVQARITQNLIEPSYELVDKYEVQIYKTVQIEQNLPGHVPTLRDRHIFTPGENRYGPSQDNFDYHRAKTFLR
jgi:hypothetical protein